MVNTVLESLHVSNANGTGGGAPISGLPPVGGLEQVGVHPLEGPLFLCADRRGGCGLRRGMVRKREMTVVQLDASVRSRSFEHRVYGPTVRALVVAEFDHDRGATVPAEG